MKQVNQPNGPGGADEIELLGAPRWNAGIDRERSEPGSPEGGEERLRAEIKRLRATVLSLERERDQLTEELQAARSAPGGGAPDGEAPGGDRRDQLLSMVSHELRTPLQSLNMGLGLLLSRFRAAADEVPRPWALSRLEKAQRNAARLTQLVETLLDVSRMQEGRLDLQVEEVDFSVLVERAVARARDELSWAGCACSVSTPGPVMGRWDRVRLDLVVSNLLSNAMKYGAGQPIHIHVESDPASAKLTVQDQGVGIALQDQQRIFERFERTSTASCLPGLGLGLWIVRHLVEAMGGTVRVESRPGEGASFTVLLPRAPA